MSWYEIAMMTGLPAIISSLVIILFETIIRKASEKTKVTKCDHENLKYGVQALLRDRLMLEHDEYIKKGWIDVAKKRIMITCTNDIIILDKMVLWMECMKKLWRCLLSNHI